MLIRQKSRCTKDSPWSFTAVQSNICARNDESMQVTRTTIAYMLLSPPLTPPLLLLLNNDDADDGDEDGARRAAETAVTRCLVSRVNVSCPRVRYLMKLCVGLNAD